jgi:hypothetical protein
MDGALGKPSEEHMSKAMRTEREKKKRKKKQNMHVPNGICFFIFASHQRCIIPTPSCPILTSAEDLFMQNVPIGTARNLVYVVFSVLPPLFLMTKRRLAFYKRAQTHDLRCVQEAFLFDMTHLFPHDSSWTAQLYAILSELGLTVDTQRMNFVELCEKVIEATVDVDDLCFRHIRASEEKTLSFFRIFPNAATARDFRNFLSTRSAAAQNFLLLFLSSGLRWRFFRVSSRGRCCPLCRYSFWPWEHFLQCRALDMRSTLFHECAAAAFTGDWTGLVDGVRVVTRVWASRFDPGLISFTPDAIDAMFSE